MIARQKSPNPCGTIVVTHPTITSISPSAAEIGSTVTIHGTNFGSSASGNTVTFNGITATSFSSWSSTSISVDVPVGATSGNVIVTVDGQASNSYSFVVGATPAPVITSIAPNIAPVGSPVAIHGSNFGNSGTVTFNGIASAPLGWSDTTILAPVPVGAMSGNVIVTAHGQPSNGQAFTVNALSLAFDSYTVYGDSISQGELYTHMIRDHFSLASAFENRALMGTTSFELLDRLYNQTVPTGLPMYTTLIGTNNYTGEFDTYPQRAEIYKHSMASMLAWLATHSSVKVNARDTTKVTYTGQWHDQWAYCRIWPMDAGGNPVADSLITSAPIGKYSAETDATAEFKVTGSVIYLFFTKWVVHSWFGWPLGIVHEWGEPPNASQCAISVDGGSPTSYYSGNVAWGTMSWTVKSYVPGHPFNPGPPAATWEPEPLPRVSQHCPWWVRIDNLSPGEHDVKLTVLNDPGSLPTDRLTFEWAVGLPQPGSLNALPRVYPIPVLPRFFNGGTMFELTFMENILIEVVRTMQGDGLRNIRGPVPFIDMDRDLHFPPSDPLHPNAAGQTKIGNDVIAFITGDV